MFSFSAPSLRGWRVRIVALFAAALLVAGLNAGNASRAEAAAKPATVTTQVLPASVPAPSWLVSFVRSRAGGAAQGILEAMGFQCATQYVCWHNTDYDPPRWFYYGRVDTGLGSAGHINARGWASTGAPIIRTFPEGWKLVIFCQTHGQSVYGRWGWTNIWDYVGHYGDAPMFVSDGFVNTGSNGFVSGDCGATNMGGNP